VRVPTTQVPLGLDARGIPLGIQVGAMHGQDHRTMAVAIALEDAFGGWVRPRL
jgi:fatty acid amide hydrolase 2